MKRNSLRWLILGLMFTVLFNAIGMAQSNGDSAKGEQLVSQARQAIGGEARLNEVNGLGLEGKINRPGQVQEQAAKLKLTFMTRTLDGTPGQVGEDVEFNIKIDPKGEGRAGTFTDEKGQVHKIDGDKVIIFKEAGKDGVNKEQKADGQKMVIISKVESKDRNQSSTETKVERDVIVNIVGHGGPHGAPPVDLIHSMVGLLLKSPTPVQFNYIGDAENGTADAISIKDSTPFSTTLLLDKATHLPVGINFFGSLHEPVFVRAKQGEKVDVEKIKKQIEVKEDQKTEVKLRFSDHRLVDGVLLPHRITRAVNGEIKEEYEIEKYEINPAVKMEMRRMKKEQ